jgi:hypothetical protein
VDLSIFDTSSVTTCVKLLRRKEVETGTPSVRRHVGHVLPGFDHGEGVFVLVHQVGGATGIECRVGGG